MRATEFIAENAEGSIVPGIADAMPSTFVLPQLKSQDPYMQYRFGLALAAARAQAAGETTYDTESKFGEDMVVIARSTEEEETLRMALALFGKMNSSQQVSNSKSKEAPDVYHQSPLPKRVKNRNLT